MQSVFTPDQTTLALQSARILLPWSISPQSRQERTGGTHLGRGGLSGLPGLEGRILGNQEPLPPTLPHPSLPLLFLSLPTGSNLTPTELKKLVLLGCMTPLLSRPDPLNPNHLPSFPCVPTSPTRDAGHLVGVGGVDPCDHLFFLLPSQKSLLDRVTSLSPVLLRIH